MPLFQFLPFSTMELLLAATIFCLVLWVVRASWPQVPKGLKSPPGPWGWPLIGHVLTLGKNPHLALARLSARYGDVLQIRIGSTPVVVLSGPDTIRQALVRQGDDFKGRPDLYSFTLITDGQSMAFNPDSGPVWAARRHLALDALKSFSVASDPASSSSCYLEEHASREAEHLVTKLLDLMAGPGCFDPFSQMVGSVANVIGSMCFGKNFPKTSEEMLSIVKTSNDFVESASSANPVDFFPILRYLPNPTLQRFKSFNERFLRFLQKTVQEHYQDFDKNSVQDIASALFKHSEEGPQVNGDLIPHKKIVNLVNDIFGAGFDTVTTAITWSLMYLVTKPEIQKKIQKELDTVIGRDRRPQLADRPRLPYLEAFILEVFRHSSFVPFTIPHRKQWEDPFEFRPERFLVANHTALNKTLSDKVLLFGLGKRRCIGETLGRWEVFLFLAILLQRLEFSVPPGVKVDMTPIYGLTMKPPRCQHLQARARFTK
ncbi:PREDICTED: cytochrome P450 1A2 isoform X2 [Chinchilla lanigera]|uniref:cytochrome P450 1A2 isoform X2 n=1 Tax=Chinchilla lanigera TaxID=34839 RepID=UPI00038ECC07|nr:PREDICTED: cytochrome P450 1A2 isoform X2 [Chinchilla lanigera]